MRHDNRYYAFLAAVLSGVLERPLSAPDWDWEQLIRIAADESILPALSARIEELKLNPVVPRDVMDFLTAYAELNSQRNQQILTELEEIAGLLNRAGIEPLVLKGPAYLLTRVYENPAHRFILDIDLLLPETRIDDAFLILQRAGYSAESADPIALAAHHRPALAHPDRIRVELHHRLGSARCAPLLSPEEIWDRSSRFELKAATVRIPHPSDLVTHLVAHSQIHHGSDQRVWPPLRVQYDLVLVNNHFASEIDWQKIRERFQQARFDGLLKLHLLQVAHVLQMKAPFPIHLASFDRLRWWHRRILWRVPGARFIDPIFFLSAATNVRPSLRHVLAAGGGTRFLLTPYFLGRACRKLANSFRR